MLLLLTASNTSVTVANCSPVWRCLIRIESCMCRFGTQRKNHAGNSCLSKWLAINCFPLLNYVAYQRQNQKHSICRCASVLCLFSGSREGSQFEVVCSTLQEVEECCVDDVNSSTKLHACVLCCHRFQVMAWLTAWQCQGQARLALWLVAGGVLHPSENNFEPAYVMLLCPTPRSYTLRARRVPHQPSSAA